MHIESRGHFFEHDAEGRAKIEGSIGAVENDAADRKTSTISALLRESAVGQRAKPYLDHNRRDRWAPAAARQVPLLLAQTSSNYPVHVEEAAY